MTDPDREIWDGMLVHLREHHPALCRHWFEDLQPVRVADGSVFVRAVSEVHRDYLRRECVNAFVDAAQSASNSLLGVRFLGPGDHSPDNKSEPTPPKHVPGRDADRPAAHAATTNNHPGEQAADTQIKVPLPNSLRKRRASQGSSEQLNANGSVFLNPDYVFENFIVGEGNRWAYAAAIAVAENPGQAYNPLFIHGDVGLGKTHLLQAICLRIKQDRPEAVLHYVSCDEFINEFIQSLQSNQMEEFRRRFRDVDVLVIDDIHFLTDRERSQEEFFHTFNYLHQMQKQIIISSDAPPKQIPNLEHRLTSRFQSGLIAEVDRPTFETRVAILLTKARLRGIALENGVAEFVAMRFETNIRELEGAITQLQVYASVEGGAIDLALAHKAFGAEPAAARPLPTIDEIILIVCRYYDVKRIDLLGKRRHQSISLPRQVCMFLARAHTRLSLEEIGAQFGGRDHTTVMHAVKTVKAKQSTDTAFANSLTSLESDLLKAASGN